MTARITRRLRRGGAKAKGMAKRLGRNLRNFARSTKIEGKAFDFDFSIEGKDHKSARSQGGRVEAQVKVGGRRKKPTFRGHVKR